MQQSETSIEKVPWGPGQAVWVFLTAWVGVPALALVLLNAAQGLVPGAAEFMAQLQSGSLQASFVFSVLDAAAGLGIIALVLRRYGLDWRALGLRRFNITQALWLVGLALVVFFALLAVVFALVSWLYPEFDPNQSQVNSFTDPQTREMMRLSFVALVVLPPVLEETVFRGFMFPAFAKRFGMVWGAVLSSILFGFAHMQLNVGIYTTLLGILLCALYVRTRSIIPGMALHMINNLMAFSVLIVQ